MERIVLYWGFNRTRQKGSHVFYRHVDGRTTTKPFHKGRDLARPLTRDILWGKNISIDKYVRLLDEIK